MMKNKKKLLIPLSIVLLIIAFVIYGLLSANINLNNGSTTSGNDQDSSKDAELSTTTDSDSSLKDVLDQNNQELLKLIDTRKTVVFAIYGIDDKFTEEGRSDIIMVVKYDPSLKKMIIVSIPRDLRVDVPGYGMTKINAAYAYGGDQLINQVVEELLGIKLDFSIWLNFDTFASIIDSVGGVSIDAKKDFYSYSGESIVIKEGKQVLNGKKTLFYVRFRSDSDVDYGRIGRQQEVVISLMEYLKSTTLQKKINLLETYYNKGIETDANATRIINYFKMTQLSQPN